MTVEEILAQTRSLIQTKQAEFKKKSSVGDEATTNPPESIGEMKPVEEEAKKTTPKEEGDEDRNVDETEGRSTAGAGHPDVGREQAMDSEEAVENPTKKPAVSSDANAKTAADLANDLMASIRTYQSATEEKKAEQPKAEEKKADAPKVEEGKKASKDDEFELTTDVLAKLAALIVATDEGKELARDVMAKEAGAEAARETIAFVEQKQAEAAEYLRGQAIAEQLLTKFSSNLSKEDAEYVKLGQALADETMGMDPAMLEAALGAEGAPVDPAMGAPVDPMMAAAPAEEEVAEGDIGVEDLAEAIDQLVAADVIAPEEAGEILDYLVSAEGGEGEPVAEEATPAEEAPAPVEVPADEAASIEEAKEAKVKPQAKKSAKINKLAHVLAMHIGAAKVASTKQTPVKK